MTRKCGPISSYKLYKRYKNIQPEVHQLGLPAQLDGTVRAVKCLEPKFAKTKCATCQSVPVKGLVRSSNCACPCFSGSRWVIKSSRGVWTTSTTGRNPTLEDVGSWRQKTGSVRSQAHAYGTKLHCVNVATTVASCRAVSDPRAPYKTRSFVGGNSDVGLSSFLSEKLREFSIQCGRRPRNEQTKRQRWQYVSVVGTD